MSAAIDIDDAPARSAFAPGRSFFFTLVTRARAPVFANPASVQRLRSSLRRAMLRRPFQIDAAVVLPDHLHVVLTLPAEDVDFAARWRMVRADFSRWHALEHPLGRLPARARARRAPGPWHRQLWHFCVRDAEEYARYLDYVHYDPVHHGLCTAPREWRFSSFRQHVRRERYANEWGADGVPASLEYLQVDGDG